MEIISLFLEFFSLLASIATIYVAVGIYNSQKNAEAKRDKDRKEDVARDIRKKMRNSQEILSLIINPR